LVEAQKREAEWKEKEQVWSAAPSNSTSGWGVIEDDPHHHLWVSSEEKLFTTFHAMSRGVWLSVEKGLRCQLKSIWISRIQRRRSAPPVGYLYTLVAFQSLTYLASYVTAPSVLPMEVARPLVPVEELTHSSSPASMLPAALGKALGISLSEVMDRYFNGSDEETRVRRIEEALDCRRTFGEGEEWLARESRKTEAMLERIHRGQDDDLF
jgi:hypothetical protein